MIKTYVCESKPGLNLTILTNKRYKIIAFIPRSQFAGGCTYTTESKDLQDAIEANNLFGNVIKLQSIIGAEKEDNKEATLFADAEAETTAVKEYADVTRLAEAAHILATEYGVDASAIKRKAAIIEVAKNYNVSFPNLK